MIPNMFRFSNIVREFVVLNFEELKVWKYSTSKRRMFLIILLTLISHSLSEASSSSTGKGCRASPNASVAAEVFEPNFEQKHFSLLNFPFNKDFSPI